MSTPSSLTFGREALDQLRSIFSSHQSEMSDIARNMAMRVGGMGMAGMPVGAGVRQGADLADSAAELKKFIAMLKRGQGTLSATEKYQLGAARRQLKATNDQIKATEEERKKREENTGELEDASRAQNENSRQISDSTRRLAGFAEKVVGGTLSFTAAARAINEFSQAYKQGFNWNALSDTVEAALKMGMSPKDMMDFQKRFRRVSNTLEGGISEFNDTVGASNVEWMHFTGSLKDAANAQGEFYDLALSMGVGAKDMKGAVGGMFSEFKKLQVATSMTAEEFVATQKSLLGEKAVRDKLIGLQGKERINYMNKLTDTAYMFQTLGLQKEAAEGMVKLIESQSSKGGVVRLREGAQLQAAAGIIGMSGQDAANLNRLRGKRNLSSEEQTQLAALYADMSKRIEAKKNAGGFSEYQMDALEQQFPILQELVNQVGGTMALAEGAAAKQSTIAAQALDLQERDSSTYGAIKENIVRFANIFEGWSQSALAALLAIAAGKLALNYLPSFGGGGGGGGGPGGGGWKGALAKYGPKLLKGGLLGAVAAGAGTMIVDSTVDDKTVAGGLKGAIQGGSLGATIGSMIAPGIGTAIGAAVGGVGGALVGILMNQETVEDSLDNQKKKLIDQQNLDESRYQLARQQYQKEIDQLTRKGELSDEEQKRLDALQKKMDDAAIDHSANQNKASVSQVGYQLDKQSLATDWMAQSAKDIAKGGWFSDTDSDDVRGMLSELRGKLSATGVNLTDDQIKTRFGSILSEIAASKDGKDDRNAGFDAANALMSGSGSYNTKLANPMIAEAMGRMSSQLSTGFAEANQATFAAKLNTPEALAALQDQVKATSEQMAKDKASLAALQNVAIFDETGYNSAEAAKLQKRLDTSQQTLTALQQLATKDNSVKFESEQQLLEVLKKLSDSLDGSKVQRVKA